jgi:hypothetical protein
MENAVRLAVAAVAGCRLLLPGIAFKGGRVYGMGATLRVDPAKGDRVAGFCGGVVFFAIKVNNLSQAG